MHTSPATVPKRVRLWPGVAAAAVMVVMRLVIPALVPEAMIPGLLGMVAGALAIILWWTLFSRAPWAERLGALASMAIALFVIGRLVHPSIAGAGQGKLLYVLAVPVMCLTLVGWAVGSRGVVPRAARLASMAASLWLACGLFALLRTDGISSSLWGAEYHWRFTPTAEERLMAQAEPAPVPPTPTTPPSPTAGSPAMPAEGTPAPAPAASAEPRAAKGEDAPVAAPAARNPEWPGFRGPTRDSVIRGVRIETDWAKSPPALLWKRPIGPGWSSFAAAGNRIYTQEQRGEEELVSCYDMTTGDAVWRHRDTVRFWESNGGAGPRATPTLHDGRVYALGATGIVNALDAATGALVWSRNAATDADRKLPTWGFTASPLIVGDALVVAVSGTLAAYEATTGQTRWLGPKQGGTYSSPQLATLGGVPQILLLSAPGAVAVAPEDGALLWEHAWEGSAITQPALTPDGDLLINAITATGGVGIRRLAVSHEGGAWTVQERWTSNGLKPYFNDFVVHEGHAYGFDGNILSSIDLADGTRKWKGGRYGNGQLLLLADQDLLLVISEEGELALVNATPDGYKELARLPAIEGKTWNHPALVGDVLLVRNGEEMAAFRMAVARR